LFFYSPRAHRHLHSFPTRRSSDLSMSLLSIFACSCASPPLRTGAILLLTLATAFLTPLPPKRLVSSSRNSHASCSPVLAPLGTAARPSAPCSRRTSTSIVGLPRESRISRAWIWLMLVCAITILGGLEQLSQIDANHLS